MTLPDVECAFFFAALAQLEPAMRQIFIDRVGAILGAHPDPGPGDVDRTIRQALVGLWVPPEFNEQRGSGWNRDPSGARRVKSIVPARIAKRAG